MCLDKLKPIPKRKPTKGWKVFMSRSGGLITPMQGTSCIRPEGVWIKDGSSGNLPTTGYRNVEAYPTGFHIFCNKADAEGFLSSSLTRVVRRVRCRDIVAYGTNGYRGRGERNTIVAREMYIEPIGKSPNGKKGG